MGARVRSWLLFLLVGLALAGLTVVLRADIAPADVFLQAGDLLSREWRFRDALVMYGRAENAAEGGAQRVRATLGVASSAVRVAEFELAYMKAARLVQMLPQDLEVRTVYGQAAWSAGLFAEAEAAFRDVLAARPRDVRALLGTARVLTAHNRLEDALDAALAAAAGDPNDADSASVVASTYKRMRRMDDAAAWYTKYLSLLPLREADKRVWTQGEIQFLRSFGRKAPAQLDPRARGVVHTIPFRLVDDKVMVKGRVNDSEWVEFALDTGAEQTVLSQTTAHRLGVTPLSGTISAGVGEMGLRGLQNGRLESLQIGSLVVTNVPCLIKTPPLAELPNRESESFSPLALGLSVVIDYNRREVLLGDRIAREEHEVQLPLWFTRLATVRGVVNAETSASFIIDTGGQVVSISQDTARTLSVQPYGRRISLLVFGTSGRDRDAYLLPGVSVKFDSLALDNFSVVVLNLRAPSVLLGYRVGGTVGHHFLSKYRVTFDLNRSVLGLSRGR
ncbi:MAG: retroviral-like aspartic protease family protein [Bacteroidales bacterium]